MPAAGGLRGTLRLLLFLFRLVAHRLLEVADPLADPPAELGEAPRPEDEDHDHAYDDEFGKTETGHVLSLPGNQAVGWRTARRPRAGRGTPGIIPPSRGAGL